MGRKDAPESADVSARMGLWAVSAAGATWSAFLIVLYSEGHAPSFALVSSLRPSYYLVQALITIPWLVVMWRASVWVATRVAPPKPGRSVQGRWGVIAAGCLFAFHLAPEMVAYAVGGMEMLRLVVRWTMPLSLIATLTLTTHAVIRTSGCTPLRGFAAALLGLVVNAMLAGPVLR